MTEKFDINHCEICGNIIEVVHDGAGQLVCCGQPMIPKPELTKEQEGKEKHIPIIEKTSEGVKVKIGSIEHPMNEEHYIEWIEIITNDGKLHRKLLTHNDKPEATFKINNETGFKIREYCSIHGLWKS